MLSPKGMQIELREKKRSKGCMNANRDSLERPLLDVVFAPVRGSDIYTFRKTTVWMVTCVAALLGSNSILPTFAGSGSKIWT